MNICRTCCASYVQKRAEAMRVTNRRQNLITYALEEIPRPGAHEIRVRPTPDGMRIRNRGKLLHGQ